VVPRGKIKINRAAFRGVCSWVNEQSTDGWSSCAQLQSKWVKWGEAQRSWDLHTTHVILHSWNNSKALIQAIYIQIRALKLKRWEVDKAEQVWSTTSSKADNQWWWKKTMASYTNSSVLQNQNIHYKHKESHTWNYLVENWHKWLK